MSRIDHINNPDAPAPNSVVPSAVAFILDDQERVLLIQRSDNGDWALPGGGHDLGEHIAETAVRETKEETGLDVEVTGLIGIYTDPRHLIEYSDGEVRQQFSIACRATPIGGRLAASDESMQVAWVSAADLADLSINPSMRLRIEHGFANAAAPFLG
ncbi:NUDIX domain-containing protein [Glycomyces sp. A-F 0318]|uniref:NUDIX domain-containing protein n=1 Tax=Glycomyces amatae TaxID=2881355 RepID=UPI001E57D029|nr:NUDIX domain-containing protein [Glycomyces amatae]MCD0446274.1 NUDIX domain-containing protein [Glycomyces amatae]